MATDLERARRETMFLDDVGLLESPPTRLTMALAKRPPYRAALEGYLELHRNINVRLEEPALEAPLENLPALYQLWGSLEVLSALPEAAADVGYRVRSQRLIGRDIAGVYVRILPDGAPALELEHSETGTMVRLIPARTYGARGAVRSISFPQRPDVAIEVEAATKPTRVYLFDPKYKLDREEQALDGGTGDDRRPQKADVDKMHAYRDAIRDADARRVVHYAAILYPGPTVSFSEDIEALRAYPESTSDLADRLVARISSMIAPSLATAGYSYTGKL